MSLRTTIKASSFLGKLVEPFVIKTWARELKSDLAWVLDATSYYVLACPLETASAQALDIV
jgi:hypothetical protein